MGPPFLFNLIPNSIHKNRLPWKQAAGTATLVLSFRHNNLDCVLSMFYALMII